MQARLRGEDTVFWGAELSPDAQKCKKALGVFFLYSAFMMEKRLSIPRGEPLSLS